MGARTFALTVVALGVVACGRPTVERAADARPSATGVAASSVDASAPGSPPPLADASAPTVTLIPELPLTAPPTPGPLRVDGYPAAIQAVNSDAATPFGFTRDGAQFAYCMFDACCAEDMSRCMLTDANGKRTTLDNPSSYGFLEGAEKAAASRRTNAELRAFARDEGLVALGTTGESTTGETARIPPVPRGTWAFGGDMTLVVRAVAPTEGKGPDDVGHLPGYVKIGARLEGEREVFVVFPRAPFCVKVPQACYDAHLNGLALSPDGSELGFLVFVRNPSHGSSFGVVRMPVTAFAARIFNDTGMLHHTKKAYGRAVELFIRAVHADPSEERFAFNLACALARSGDARAEHALRYAVARGGDAVRQRAQKDPDLEAVRAAPWFARALE